jgi:hypothetical protein
MIDRGFEELTLLCGGAESANAASRRRKNLIMAASNVTVSIAFRCCV